MEEFTIEEEKVIEGLIGDGFITERFDKGEDEVVREVTPRGKEKIKGILKNPKERKKFIQLAKKELESVPVQFRKEIFEKMCEVLEDG